LQGCCHGVGAEVEALARRKCICHQNNAVGKIVLADVSQDFAAKVALQRGVAKFLQLVESKQKGNEPVAQGADAVVKQQGPAFDRNVLRLGHVFILCPLILEVCPVLLPVRVIYSFVLKDFFREASTRRSVRFVLWVAIRRL
jgi:hypothetical protein